MEDYDPSQCQQQLQDLIDSASQSHQPIIIAGQHSNAVLLSEADWAALQETLVPSLYARDAGIDSRRTGNVDRGVRSLA